MEDTKTSDGDQPLLPMSSKNCDTSDHPASKTDGNTTTDEIDAYEHAQTTINSVAAHLIRNMSEGQLRPETMSLGDGVQSMANLGRLLGHFEPSKATNQRLVQKNGDCNVTSHNVMKRNRKYLVDIFTTLVDMKWRYHIFMFAAAFFLTWLLFGVIWLGIAVYHNDHLYVNNDTWRPCVDNVYDFKTALLFSIETQHTIGYGYRVIQSECSFAIFIMMLQSCLGLFIQSLITGIIFAKISRPKGRAQTIMFSQKAVICRRDGEYCLLFRVGDMRKSHIIGTSIRTLLVKNRRTSEGESIPICQYPLDIETETSTSDSFVFLIWPVTVVHKINETSPLWDLSLMKLLSEHFEIIVILEGTIESTGMLTQVRTSYIPSEIMWGEKLVPLMTYQLNGHCEIDYHQFHSTTPMRMSEISAKDYAELKKLSKLEPFENEYPVSFTAPAFRPKVSRLSVHSLFPRRATVSSIKVKSVKKAKPEPEKKTGRTQSAVQFRKSETIADMRHRPVKSGSNDLIDFGNGVNHQYKRNANQDNGKCAFFIPEISSQGNSLVNIRNTKIGLS